jgi:hypothetical protein
MRRWLPHIHTGGVSSECIRDDAEEGREGYYFEVCWFGWMFGFTLTSQRWQRQYMARLDAKYGVLLPGSIREDAHV